MRATIQEAQPIGIERGAIVFGAPRQALRGDQRRFRSEAPAIKAALEARLGAQPKLPHPRARLRARSTRCDPSRPRRARAARRRTAEPTPPDEPIDLDDLTDAPDAPLPDPAARLVAGLGAQVVEEHSRD